MFLSSSSTDFSPVPPFFLAKYNAAVDFKSAVQYMKHFIHPFTSILLASLCSRATNMKKCNRHRQAALLFRLWCKLSMSLFVVIDWGQAVVRIHFSSTQLANCCKFFIFASGFHLSKEITLTICRPLTLLFLGNNTRSTVAHTPCACESAS